MRTNFQIVQIVTLTVVKKPSINVDDVTYTHGGVSSTTTGTPHGSGIGTTKASEKGFHLDDENKKNDMYFRVNDVGKVQFSHNPDSGQWSSMRRVSGSTA